MSRSTVLSIALLAALGAWGSTAARAQGSRGSVMIMHGVHTTPEISRKCTDYARKRVGVGGHTDTSRQAIAAACVRKLMAKQNKRAS